MVELPPDRLNEIGVLTRREVEARIPRPVPEALGAEFGRDRVMGIARDVIVDVARTQGRELAERMGGNGLEDFVRGLEEWKKGDAYRMDALLSCNRDCTLVEGFNAGVRLTRTQTIMQGASHCDFRFERVAGKDAGA